MPDLNTEQRLNYLERSISSIESNLDQLVRVQEELKTISGNIVEILSNNRYLGSRMESLERKHETVLDCIQELQINQGKIDTQISGVWKVIGIVNALALAVFGWFLSRV